jgi:hypothetical protein
MVPASVPQENNTPPAVLELLELRAPTRPSRRLPTRLCRQLPDPLRHYEDLLRFRHEDIAVMSPAARGAEAFRLKVVLSLVDAEDVPTWLLRRLERLDMA